ncbi:MAG: ABC transporter permease subunit, partial [Sulfobacillus sp.]|nr:ABC transporter permease subunit [Sulfobacillus sp.]
AIFLVNLWLGFPFFMVSLLGGLQSLPADILEAAMIDGATSWQVFRFITFPLLWRFSLPLLLGTFAFNFNNFSIVYLLTGGGPPRPTTAFAGTTDVLSTVIYNMTLTFNRYDIAAALGIILFLFVAGLTILQLKIAGGLGEVDL